jgi:hypothetical protein
MHHGIVTTPPLVADCYPSTTGGKGQSVRRLTRQQTDKPKERHPNIDISQTYISRERLGRVNSGKTKGRQE